MHNAPDKTAENADVILSACLPQSACYLVGVVSADQSGGWQLEVHLNPLTSPSDSNQVELRLDLLPVSDVEQLRQDKAEQKSQYLGYAETRLPRITLYRVVVYRQLFSF